MVIFLDFYDIAIDNNFETTSQKLMQYGNPQLGKRGKKS